MSSNRSRAHVDDIPLAKKLRSSEPDLKVVLGSCEYQTTRWYHSPTLASKSNYIDTMLAVPMKERQDMAISFPDISVDIWDDMMKFLDQPIAIQNMTARDAINVAKHYDKYEFSDGKVLCDHILVKCFRATQEQEETLDLDIDDIVDAVVVASEANLDSAFKEGISYIWSKVQSVSAPYGRTMFTEEHMKDLAPLLSATQYMDVADFSSLPYGMLRDEDFPRLFVEKNAKWLESYTFHTLFLSHIELSGTNCNADGKFHADSSTSPNYDCDRVVNWNGNQFNVAIEQDEYDVWTIIGKTLPTIDGDGEEDYGNVVETTWWKAPCTENHSIPPQKGWKAIDPLATGNPTIRYVTRTS